MKIKKLIERENFYLVLKQTLECFFQKKFNINIKIVLNLDKNIEKNSFLISPILNIIYSSDISSEIIYPYIKEYFHHKNQIRSILQKIYYDRNESC